MWEEWGRWGMGGGGGGCRGDRARGLGKEGCRAWGRWGFREVGKGEGVEWVKLGNGVGGEYGRWRVRGWEVGKVGSRVGGK